MRSVAIITGPPTHLDHLGILSTLLDIPLIVTDEESYRIAKQFYPDFQIACVEPGELTVGCLAENFDLIFETGKFWALELAPVMELLFRKKMRFVFCPHGNSDKGHSLQHHADQDVSLVYGAHLLDHLEKTGAAKRIKHIFSTGNYRYSYYLKHRAHFDALAEALVFNKFQLQRKTLLYAPTWNDGENATTFFAAADALIDQLSSDFNILIKLHPLLIEEQPAETHVVMSRYEENPSVQFLTAFPAIYPLLARCDAYLGDTSSIGYDFLAFDRPLYFLGSNESPLQLCGEAIPLNELDQLHSRIAGTFEASKEKFREARQRTYAYAFDREATLAPLKEFLTLG